MKCLCSNCGWLDVNPGGAMFCGYSDERTWENESCQAWKEKDEPQTNADRIRTMTDEELAVWISALYTTQYHVRGDPDFWIDWLRKEVSE